MTKLYENATSIEVTARTRSDGRTHTDACTDTQKLPIVATMSRSPQAGRQNSNEYSTYCFNDITKKANYWDFK